MANIPLHPKQLKQYVLSKLRTPLSQRRCPTSHNYGRHSANGAVPRPTTTDATQPTALSHVPQLRTPLSQRRCPTSHNYGRPSANGAVPRPTTTDATHPTALSHVPQLRTPLTQRRCPTSHNYGRHSPNSAVSHPTTPMYPIIPLLHPENSQPDVTPYSLVDVYRQFIMCDQDVTLVTDAAGILKRWYACSRPHGVTFQETAAFRVICCQNPKTSDLNYLINRFAKELRKIASSL